MKSIVDVDYYPTMNSDSHIKAYDDKKSEENGTTGTSVEQGNYKVSDALIYKSSEA